MPFFRYFSRGGEALGLLAQKLSEANTNGFVHNTLTHTHHFFA